MFGTTKHWHKRIVRSGPHTLFPYRENPPDRVIEADDIAFADFGPIFEEFEADLGRTYVLGADPVKHRLAADLPRHLRRGPAATSPAIPPITGAAAARRGRPAGGRGRVVRSAACTPGTWSASSRTRRSTAPPSSPTSPRATPRPMRRHDKAGQACHWILEIHLTDPARGFGGFYEQLLDLG